MWQRYRKTFVPMQLLIVSFIAFVTWRFQVPVIGALWLLLAMEVASLMGAAWAYRLQRKFEATPMRDLKGR